MGVINSLNRQGVVDCLCGCGYPLLNDVRCVCVQTCSVLWDYKDCKSSLKKLGWDVSHYHHLASDEETQMELEPRGSVARGDFQGSSRRKQYHHRGGGGSSKRSSKKSSKKKDRDREREEAGVGFIAGGLPRAPEAAECQIQSATSVATMSSPVRPGNNPHVVAEIQEEPNYQVIPPPPSSARPSNHNRQHDQQQQVVSPSSTGSPIAPNYESVTTSPVGTTASSAPTQSGPNIIYQVKGRFCSCIHTCKVLHMQACTFRLISFSFIYYIY